MKKLAVMQPYLFPYIGYFQLIQATDKFVFYDDVNFIKHGWINRNRILLNGEDYLFTVPCEKISPNKKINEISYNSSHPFIRKTVKTIEHSYSKAPFFDQAFPIIKDILNSDLKLISSLAEKSVCVISKYLGIETEFKTSSRHFPSTESLERDDRLISICKLEGVNGYINSIGGEELYDKGYFLESGIDLSFIKSNEIVYKQFKNNFVSNLSIIDVLMFNSIDDISNMLTEYKLV